MNDFNYLYGLTPISPIGFSGNPFGVSASLKARKANLEAIKKKIEEYSCVIENKKLIALGNSVTELSDLLISSENGND